MEVLQPTLAASLVVLLYVLIKEVIVPLIKGKKDDGPEKSNGDGGGIGKYQEHVNDTHGKRLDSHARQLSEHSSALSDIGKAVAIIEAIVTRIEERM